MAGVYIHIPFCKKACNYCNFHFSTSLSRKSSFISALQKEIAAAVYFNNPDEIIDTVYFGGGTPSLLSADELRIIFDSLHNKFVISKEAEITLEANPDDIDELKLVQWLHTGINRISLGIQSFSDKELIWMNRAHNALESEESIKKIQEAGFKNFSVDLIYGSQLSETEDLQKNLERIFKFKVPHISCYALTVEPKTNLFQMIRMHRMEPVDADKQSAQFLLIMELMQQAGYEHYEISNYALPGKHSRHNSSYWQGKAYYGFGPSAHSYDGLKTRRWNVANNTLYIEAMLKGQQISEEEILSDIQRMNEYIMTSLRTSKGINLEFLRINYGINHTETLKKLAEKYIGSGKLMAEGKHLVLSNEGKLFADGIAADLFF